MPVLGFTGLPGHGKSYGVVANVIYPALEKGRVVVTNIPMNREALRERLKEAGVKGPMRLLSIDVQDFADGEKTFSENIPDGAVVVLDELWRLWPSGLKANDAEEDHKSFLAEHRHRVGTDGRTMEIILVTQDLNQISAFARTLVERTYVVTKLKEVGLDNSYVVEIFAGVRMAGKGGHLISKTRGRYDPKNFALYKSHTKSDAVGLEEEADSRGTVYGAAIVRYGIPAGILCFVAGAFGLLATWEDLFFSGDGDVQAAELVVDEAPRVEFTAQPVAAPVAPPPPVIPEPPQSRIWRIAGILADESGEGVAYLKSNRGPRTVSLELCELVEAHNLEYECIVDGERITSWTGGGATLARTLGVVQN